MTTHTVTVTFSIEAESATHAVFLVNKMLADHGLHQGGEVELTPGQDGERRVEKRDGYKEITTT